MRARAVAAWTVAVFVVILRAHSGASERQEHRARPAQDLTGTAVITGRVVSGSGAHAIGEAVVTVVETSSGFTKGVRSDYAGAFRLEGLPAGRYVLSATKSTFISGRYGQRAPGGASRALELAAGKTASVEIKLWKAGVISGRIETARGEGLPGAVINVVRLMVDGDLRRLLPIRPNAVSSDIGEYRIYGIDPGSYYVVVTPPPVGLRKGLEQTVGYRPTFYPGAATPEYAQLVSVTPEATSVADIQVQSTQLIRVDGILQDPKGYLPSVSAKPIRVHAAVDGVPVISRAMVFAGRFSFPGLPEGAYRFHSDPMKDAEGRSVVFLAEAYVDAQQQPTVISLNATRTSAITVSLSSTASFPMVYWWRSGPFRGSIPGQWDHRPL